MTQVVAPLADCATQYQCQSDQLRQAISAAWLSDEADTVSRLLERAETPADRRRQVRDRAAQIVRELRQAKDQQSSLDAFMQEYDLSSQEGVLLMCVAEALLRIPDSHTAERLIEDKLGDADWQSHLGHSSSLFVNASSWGLMLTGKLVKLDRDIKSNVTGALKKLINKSGEPVVRLAIRQAMRIMGHQFVMGRTIADALSRSRKRSNRQYRYSFDMLGEAALTEPDAKRYFDAYADAIRKISQLGPFDDIYAAPSISVKLSALYPRYEHGQHKRVMEVLPERLLKLVLMAREGGIALTMDAEEADRLELSLEVFAKVLHSDRLGDYQGLGLALQAYQKRAPASIEWLAEQARSSGKRLPIRLVKGAYWDTEIKRAQEQGIDGYPVFTRKVNTDLSYLACARQLLAASDAFYPQFASHNAHTIAAIADFAREFDALGQFEYQRLHGMGQALYNLVLADEHLGEQAACRVYAPVGSHEDLLPYLVRRLLENGANTSFVNRITDEDTPIEELVADPIDKVKALDVVAHPRIPSPTRIYGELRPNAKGINLADDLAVAALYREISEVKESEHQAGPLLADGINVQIGQRHVVTSPVDRNIELGSWTAASADSVSRAVAAAHAFQPEWDSTPADARSDALDKAADLYEQHMGELIGLCCREAGKTIADGIAEVREAVDFLRYYALHARRLFGQSLPMAGPTGEDNQLMLHGKGVFVCISPWNFPLAIFTGQVVAALASGNTVIAKPAEQTTLIAHRAVQLLHQAGIPRSALQLTPGRGSEIGPALTSHHDVTGVAFTGSTETARVINRSLAERDAPIATLIAETGGQNAMIADSSALPEQVVKDVLISAFGSAGQRCSACRVFFVQEDVADHTLKMLAGAMEQLHAGDPALLSTDIGPVIDEGAREQLQAHIDKMRKQARMIAEVSLPETCRSGSYVAPIAFEIDSIEQLEREVFGPVLHVVRYRGRDLDRVVDQINATGYGLTMGIHSRIDLTARQIQKRARVGNCYINRNQIGAIVGCQPFGGEGLSGTGPKAGGPHYLLRFAAERVVTTNTAAVGGNASLLSLGDD